MCCLLGLLGHFSALVLSVGLRLGLQTACSLQTVCSCRLCAVADCVQLQTACSLKTVCSCRLCAVRAESRNCRENRDCSKSRAEHLGRLYQKADWTSAEFGCKKLSHHFSAHFSPSTFRPNNREWPAAVSSSRKQQNKTAK